MPGAHLEQATEVFRRFLRSKDLKITRQREILLRRIFETSEHFSAESLEDRVKGDGLSKATIYRTLQLLLEGELIAEASIEDDRRFYEHIFGRQPITRPSPARRRRSSHPSMPGTGRSGASRSRQIASPCCRASSW